MNHFEGLEQSLEYLADFRYDFFRDETDTYKGKIQQLSNINISLQEADCLLFVPSGSKWKNQLGVTSYFGLPFYLKNTYWLGIGATKIVRHQTRNAYPISRVYIFSFQKHQKNEDILKGLQNLVLLKGKSMEQDIRITTGVNRIYLESRSVMPTIEAAVLQKAMESYQKGKLMYFSTYLISEDMHPKKMGTAFQYLESVNEEIAQLFRDTNRYIVVKNTNPSLFYDGATMPKRESFRRRKIRQKNLEESNTSNMNQFLNWVIGYVKRMLK